MAKSISIEYRKTFLRHQKAGNATVDLIWFVLSKWSGAFVDFEKATGAGDASGQDYLGSCYRNG
jgi:hypothetical protein